MVWFTNRQWMYQRTNSDGFANMEYGTNVNLFLEFAYSKEGAIDKRVTKHGRIVYDIKCPCFKCQNVFYIRKATIYKHLLSYDFMDNYTKWHAHGETSMHDEGQSSTAMEVDDGYQRMVLNSMPHSNYNPTYHANLSSYTLGGHTPNPKAKRFYDILQAADEPLWEGKKATNCSKLEAATNFLNWKSVFNVSTERYNYILSMDYDLLFDEESISSFPDCDQTTLYKKKEAEFAKWLKARAVVRQEQANEPGCRRTNQQGAEGRMAGKEDAVIVPARETDDNVIGDDDNDNEDVQHFFQENERLVCSVPTDDLLPITHAETNLIEEVDDVNTDDDLNESEIEHIDFDDGDEEYEDEDSD
ncbi:hypothetical protein E3N88_40047 [Mikania micrantha]|uniref:Transposase-associated domain-containing protein n=1 Tax=Mikania micrantha TaxID=192012 RepID=A0A5N6LLG7_9ASTR|nr:hypothetical protein E3N88_40047 [Mikania micrantha]